MGIQSAEIRTIIDTLKDDSQAMANPHVQTVVSQLEDEIGGEFEREPAARASDDTEMNLGALDGVTALILQLVDAVSQKQPLLELLLKIAVTYRNLGHPKRTQTLCHQILQGDTTGQFPLLCGQAFKQLGAIHFFRGQWANAEADYQQSISLFESVGEQGYMASIYNNLGYVAVEQGDYQRAQTRHQQAIHLAGQRDDCQRIAVAGYNSLAIIASIQADWDVAIDCREG